MNAIKRALEMKVIATPPARPAPKPAPKPETIRKPAAAPAEGIEFRD